MANSKPEAMLTAHTEELCTTKEGLKRERGEHTQEQVSADLLLYDCALLQARWCRYSTGHGNVLALTIFPFYREMMVTSMFFIQNNFPLTYILGLASNYRAIPSTELHVKLLGPELPFQ